MGGSGNLLALTTDFGGIWTLLTNTQPYSVGTIVGLFCANEEYCFAASDSGLVFSNSGTLILSLAILFLCPLLCSVLLQFVTVLVVNCFFGRLLRHSSGDAPCG